jgi:hypothetical protein
MTMKKILLASAAALPLLAGAAFAQSSQTTGSVGATVTPPAVTAPSVATPSKDAKAPDAKLGVGSHADVKTAPAGQTGAAADTKADTKTSLGDKPVGSHGDAKAGTTVQPKVEKKHEQKSEIEKKHERSTSANDKASSPLTTQTAKKPVEGSTEAPGKKI